MSFRAIGKTACAALLGVSFLAGCVQRLPEETPEALIERGQYLVTGIGGCNDCHTPMGPQGPDMSHSLQGADLVFQLLPGVEAPWAPHAPAIAGGHPSYSDEQLAHFLETGKRPDGSMARPPMPQFRFSPEDARAVVAYLKTVPVASEAAAPTPEPAPAP